MTRQQLTLDFDRGAQLRMLQECQLPTLTGKDGRSVARNTAKLVLHIIDHHGRGRTAFLTHDRLATQTNCSRRTTIRVIQALERASLLCVQRDGHRNCNRYTIVWSELGLLCPAPTSARAGTRHASESSPNRPTCPAPTSARAGTCHPSTDTRTRTVIERSATTAPQKICDTNRGQSDTIAGQSDTRVTLTVLEAQEEPPPPTPVVNPWQSAAAELDSLGVERIEETLQTARRRGVEAADVLDDAKTARYNSRRFQSVPRALVARLKTGYWPVEGIAHWQDLLPTSQQQRNTRKIDWDSILHSAHRQLRKQTPIGQPVDDAAWRDLASRMGVPESHLRVKFGRATVSEGTP